MTSSGGSEPRTGPGDPVPRVLGYLRADALTTDRELALGTAELAAFAFHQGYTLGTVFIERTERVPAAFQALLAEAERTGANAVVMSGQQPQILPCAWARQPETGRRPSSDALTGTPR